MFFKVGGGGGERLAVNYTDEILLKLKLKRCRCGTCSDHDRVLCAGKLCFSLAGFKLGGQVVNSMNLQLLNLMTLMTYVQKNPTNLPY